MNFFETPFQRKLLFTCLYLSEGAPIGFIWLALPTRLRARGVPIEDITWLAAILVIPWTFKFAWAPLIDLLRSRHWTLRHWIVTAQCLMGITLVPLLWIDPKLHFTMLASFLFAHALSAATQDVAIDALCISSTEPGERGQYNGWMQAGMLIGRAMMGGGALVLAAHIGDRAVIGILILLTTFSMLLVILSSPPKNYATAAENPDRWSNLRFTVRAALTDRNTWLGLLFAVLGGAGFKSLEVILGPFLVDRGFSSETIGWFSLGPMIVAMITGSLVGGWFADRIGHRRCVAASLLFVAMAIVGLAVSDRLHQESGGWHLLVWLAIASFGVGVFTASSYALFMDLTQPLIAATQFSAFMGATNGCESWSSYVSGQIIERHSYSAAMLLMSGASLIALPLLAAMRAKVHSELERVDDSVATVG